VLIKAISQDKAIGLLQEWNGSTSGSKPTDSERMFRAMCDRYVLIEVENMQELNKLDSMERYLTGGHGFYIYLRYPTEVVDAIRRGLAAMPAFFHRAEERFSSGVKRGNLKVLIGLLQEKVDQSYDTALFIDMMDSQKREQQEAARRLQNQQLAFSQSLYAQQQAQYQQQAQQVQPPQQPAQQPQQQSLRQTTYGGTDQQPTVVHYHFGEQT